MGQFLRCMIEGQCLKTLKRGKHLLLSTEKKYLEKTLQSH